MIALTALCNSPRFARLDRFDAYFAGKQYDGLRYNWDGHAMGFEHVRDAPGFNVPLTMRRPRLNLELGKRAVRRFTALIFGEDHFPAITVEDDDDASDYVNELAREAQVQLRMNEARDKGGACGTACVSFGFVAGKPRVEVHRAKHIHVLEWADRVKLRPARALKSFSYKRQIIVDGKPVEKTFFFARLWDQNTETVWEPIPEELAKRSDWDSLVPSVSVNHGFGFVPVYLAQNHPESESVDGLSDFDGFDDDMDEINRLMSATSKGTIANVDPTLVVHAPPEANSGALRKGSDNAIFSEKGAEYLELRGDSVKTAIQLAKELVQYMDESMGLVVSSPDALAGAARSAAGLRMLFAPMTAAASILREQYGGLLVELLRGMLTAARLVGNADPGDAALVDGILVQNKPTVILEPRVERTESGVPKLIERSPGSSSRITLKWPAYFQPTAADATATVDSTLKAKGVLISDRTAVRAVAPIFGVENVEEELDRLTAEADERAERFSALAPGLAGAQLQPDAENESEGEDDGENEDAEG